MKIYIALKIKTPLTTAEFNMWAKKYMMASYGPEIFKLQVIEAAREELEADKVLTNTDNLQ